MQVHDLLLKTPLASVDAYMFFTSAIRNTVKTKQISVTSLNNVFFCLVSK